MQYKTINFKGKEPCEIITEAMFEIACARADGEELVKFILPTEESAGAFYKKNISELLKTLKKMKSAGLIQFFATQASFTEATTEAVFLINKYPMVFENSDFAKEEGYVFVKI